MRLRADAIAVLSVVVLTAHAAPARAQSADARGETPTGTEIARAVEIVKADPNLATERTVKTLRWKDAEAAKPTRNPAWMEWIIGFFRFVAGSARVLVWAVVIVLAAMLAVFIMRLVRDRAAAAGRDTFVAPTHVRDLDIRPESLPADLGGAARALWDRGEHRAALALLYRGLLSRLAHVHQVPIRDSSTEGDCLALAARHLPPRKHDYASRLVRVWQQFVYAGQDVQAPTVYALCDAFASALDAPVTQPSTGGAA